MNLAVFLERIPLAMGRTKLVLAVGMVGSWVGQVPGVFLCTELWRKDLVGLYSGVALGYALLVGIYLVVIFTSDWKKYSDEARVRSEVSPMHQKVSQLEDNESSDNGSV